jgi:hypothetical protein
MQKIVSNRDLRVFGIIWGVIFSFIFYKSQSLFPIFVALVFFLAAIAFPRIFLKIRFYQIWIKFGDFLGKVNGFLISFILFCVIFAPAGIILRLMKKDLLAKKLDNSRSSYFIDRKTQPQNMERQF